MIGPMSEFLAFPTNLRRYRRLHLSLLLQDSLLLPTSPAMEFEPAYVPNSSTYAGQQRFEMCEKAPAISFLSLGRPPTTRPLSEATEIYDTDFDDDSSTTMGSSNRRSVASLANTSETTISSVEEVATPSSNGLGGFEFRLDNEKPVEGPVGPHLFSFSQGAAQDIDFNLSMSPVESPFEPPIRAESAPVFAMDRGSQSSRRLSSLNQAIAQLDDTEVKYWSTNQVVDWMYASGFEKSVVEKFRVNDIDGSILVTLQSEDLKELDIQSFGKRHRLMTEIEHLRNSKMISQSAPPMGVSRSASQSRATSRSRGYRHKEFTVPVSHEINPMKVHSVKRRQAQPNLQQDNEDVLPAESVSIVAIEQLLPKPHVCSRGEECPKYQKRQRKIERMKKQFDLDMELARKPAPTVDQGLQSGTASSFHPASEPVPSVVASSDILGGQRPEFRLDAEKLKAIQSRDPQENVRQFLSFQHVDPEPLAEQPREKSVPSRPSNDSQRQHDILRTLPKLTIPQDANSDEIDTTPCNTYGQSRSAVDAPFDPHSLFPTNNTYRHGTPFSEMDVPTTTIPMGPIARDFSQSVPPDMQYGARDPVPRGVSRLDHRRQPSFTLKPVHENRILEPIDSPEDLDRAAGGAHVHSGWMKKRKTKMLRHEWQDHHCTLRGTRLEMRKHERSADCLEYIDVDDYAVACSSLSSNKLSAAFRAFKIKNKAEADAHAQKAFAFQLIPAAEKKGLLGAVTSKTHHFSVNSRDDRIDWMRELMLAKALKQRGDGFEVNVNGNMI
ncbi:MAG: hypothetical protein M1834_003676 [Cirrosporium novae-zelandiae]|nr:MAG: hypothetical protein M1834_003676 [Cirrosporium novae-zelandiae]